MCLRPCLLTLLLAAFSLVAAGLYTDDDAVVLLDAASFQKQVVEYRGAAVVEFFAPWCGHCKNLAPVYKQLADRLKGLALVGAVDCDDKKNAQLCAAQGIKGFPTLKLFPPEQQKNPYTGEMSKIPEDFQGMPTQKSINDAVSKMYSDVHIKRLTDTQGYEAWVKETADTPKVVLLTSKSSTTVLYKSLSTQFRQRLAFAEVHESSAELAQHLQVTDFPKLLVVKGSEKTVYSGKMNAVALLEFLESHALPAGSSQGSGGKQDKPSGNEVPGLVVGIEELGVANLTDIDAQEPVWLLAFAVGDATQCADVLDKFNSSIQDMQAVVKVGRVLLTSEELQQHKGALREHGVDTGALAEPCKLQVVRFPFGEDKLESEEFATYDGLLEGKALQAFATEAIPNLAHRLDPSTMEQFMVLPRPDGKPGFAPKVILASTKEEAPGVLKALAANLASSTSLVFGYVPSAGAPEAQELLRKLQISKVPGMSVAGIMGGEGVAPDGHIKLGFQPYVGPLKYSRMHMFLKVIAQMLGASNEEPPSGPAASSGVAELTSDAVFQELCGDKAGLCVLGMLDGSDDTGAAVQVLQAVAAKREGQPLQFGWVDARRQPTFATALGVMGTASLPTVVALSTRKQRQSTLLGSFDTENINSWLDSVLVGRVATVPLPPAVPALVEGGEAAAAAGGSGSGEDLVEELVDELDLSDIMGEEIEGGPVGKTKAELLQEVEEQLKAEEEARLKEEAAKKAKKPKKKVKKKKKKKAVPVKDEL